MLTIGACSQYQLSTSGIQFREHVGDGLLPTPFEKEVLDGYLNHPGHLLLTPLTNRCIGHEP